jgi:hypothetical protein
LWGFIPFFQDSNVANKRLGGFVLQITPPAGGSAPKRNHQQLRKATKLLLPAIEHLVLVAGVVQLAGGVKRVGYAMI